MNIHLLHQGGAGKGASQTYDHAHFPQVLPEKRADFSDGNSAKDGRHTRVLNFTGRHNSPFSYGQFGSQAIRQYTRNNPIVVGDRIITHIIPMQHHVQFMDIAVRVPLAAGQVEFKMVDIDNLGGPAAVNFGPAVNLATAVDTLSTTAAEQDGYRFVNITAANGGAPLVTRWNWALAMDVIGLGTGTIDDVHVDITLLMDYVHQVEH